MMKIVVRIIISSFEKEEKKTHEFKNLPFSIHHFDARVCHRCSIKLHASQKSIIFSNRVSSAPIRTRVGRGTHVPNTFQIVNTIESAATSHISN